MGNVELLELIRRRKLLVSSGLSLLVVICVYALGGA
jgi:hypothetical protein